MGSISHAKAIKPDVGKLRKLINASLQYDWVIRIEYASDDYGMECWRQWGSTYFAIRTTDVVDTVLIAINDCYENNLSSMIRLNAEKISPRTQLLYTIYQPHSIATDTVINPARTKDIHQTNPVKVPAQHPVAKNYHQYR